MIWGFVLAILGLATLIYMRNMNLKSVLIYIAIFLALIFLIGYILLTRFLSAVGEECDTKTIAKIKSYEIRDKSCLGFAGPRYSNYYLFANGQHISNGQILDSCSIRFKSKQSIIDFNICSNQLTEFEVKN
jgi:hypothetical protein